MGIQADFLASWLLIPALLVSYTLLGAFLFRGSFFSAPARRPLLAYWRPFYNGFKFTGFTNSSKEGPSESVEAGEDQAAAKPKKTVRNVVIILVVGLFLLPAGVFLTKTLIIQAVGGVDDSSSGQTVRDQLETGGSQLKTSDEIGKTIEIP